MRNTIHSFNISNIVSELLLCLFLSSLVSFWCYSRLIIASAVTTAVVAIRRCTSDASQYLSLVSNLQPPSLRSLTPRRPLPKTVVAMNLAPIALAVVGAFTCPYMPPKVSTL